MSLPAPASAQKETRAAPRRRVLKSGIIAFNDRYSALPCTVRNLSATGAHLRAEGSINTPNTFELLIELDGFEANCEVLWRKDKDIGVEVLVSSAHGGAEARPGRQRPCPKPAADPATEAAHLIPRHLYRHYQTVDRGPTSRSRVPLDSNIRDPPRI